MKYIIGSLVAAFVAFLGFMVVDCASGKPEQFSAEVTGKYYKPPWVELRTTTDGEGVTQLETVHHPEEWHVTVSELETFAMLDVSTRAATYHAVTNHQIVSVSARRGRWTQGRYLAQLHP